MFDLKYTFKNKHRKWQQNNSGPGITYYEVLCMCVGISVHYDGNGNVWSFGVCMSVFVLTQLLGSNRGLKKKDTEKREKKRLLVWRTVPPAK